MKSISTSIFVTILCLGVFSFAHSQSPSFSQSLSNPSFYIPSLAGWHGGLAAQAQYRNQWPGIPASFLNYQLGVDGYVHKLRSAFALQAGHLQEGSDQVTGEKLQFHWAPRLSLADQVTFIPSASFEYQHYKIEPGTWSYWSQFPDPLSAGGDGKVDLYGLGLGGSLVAKSFVFGANWSFINTPREANFTMPSRLTLIASQRFSLAKVAYFTPTIVYDREGEFNALTFGSNIQYNWINLALAYRWNDAAVFAAGVDMKERLRLTYSYEVTVSSLGTEFLGSHELGIRVLFFQQQQKGRLLQDTSIL